MRMEELKNRLDGVYDFDSAKDCRNVIEILLRDLTRETAKVDEVESKLRSLALDVANDRTSAAKKASEALAGQKKTKQNVMTFIAGMAMEMKNAKKLSDKELIGEVIGGVWSNLPMNGRDSAVLSELIERYKRSRKAKKRK